MGLKIVQVDAFTAVPFAGNPAGVCLLPGPGETEWMQKVALEMNLAETAFLYRQADAGFNLRWFTPAVEVDLCGHATLASAHYLWEIGELAPGREARFFTRSGLLTAVQQGEIIELNFPIDPVTPSDRNRMEDLGRALGVKPSYVGQGGKYFLVELEDEAAVRNIKPDFKLLKELVPAVVVTARASTPGLDIISRFFAPAMGIDEDPVTGSAHCTLAAYWGKKLGKTEMAAYQASPRGGSLRVRIEGDRVLLGGQAVTVFRGELAGAASPAGL